MASDGGQAGKAPAKAPPKENAAKAAKGAGGQPPMPYERARDELTELVKRLEAGGLTLEQSLELWERGERLAAICEDWLEGARARLATAMAHQRSDGGEPGTPF
jgi:exodeoxyribonuclease VII small subunit